MTKVKFEERGILAGLVEINKEYQDFLSDIHEIVEDDLKIYMNKKDVIENHWIFKYPEKDYYGVYYKPGHQCTIDSSGEGILFENWFLSDADELKYLIKEFVYANKSDKLLLRTVIDHFRSELELLRDQDEMYEKYEEVSNFLVKTVHEAKEGK